MRKEDLFELLVKGFGMCLLVLAVIALPKMLEGAVMLWFYASVGGLGGGTEAAREMMDTLRATYMSSSIGAIIRFVIYVLVSINFLRSGSLVRKLMGRKAIAELTDGHKPSEAATSASSQGVSS